MAAVTTQLSLAFPTRLAHPAADQRSKARGSINCVPPLSAHLHYRLNPHTRILEVVSWFDFKIGTASRCLCSQPSHQPSFSFCDACSTNDKSFHQYLLVVTNVRSCHVPRSTATHQRQVHERTFLLTSAILPLEHTQTASRDESSSSESRLVLSLPTLRPQGWELRHLP